MPGPLNLTTPIRLGFLDDLAAMVRQNRHPVYNATGRQVGSYETLDALCQGKWLLLAGEVQPPPSQLYVSDFWGKRVPLSTQCVRAATATAKRGIVGAAARIVQPQAVAPSSAVKAVTDTNQAATGSPQTIDPNSIIPDGGASVGDFQLSADQTRVAIYGLAAVAGLALILGDGSRRRR